jgi:hypothetical protein
MSNILLVEPDYESKFPPLGLMRIATFHRELGDSVTLAKGKVPEYRDVKWHRIYVASLFTYELPRTVQTVKYYAKSVKSPYDIFVGGIGATLMPGYVREKIQCTLIEGPLDKPDLLAGESVPVATLVPDYSLIDAVKGRYHPADSYFCRVTLGCIRGCEFCAVPVLEPEFCFHEPLAAQIDEVNRKFGERQHLVLLDNNILALSEKQLDSVFEDIRRAGFPKGATRNGRKRTVDFNQAIDARLITPHVVEQLANICLEPVRLALDYDEVETAYKIAIRQLAAVGFTSFTNYVMFNYNDTPESFYRRVRVNADLSQELGIHVSGFPMRYVPVFSVKRHYIAPRWHWRYLRGIQCVLQATHGLVSPKQSFFFAAFGSSVEEFLEIISMPDRYIVMRERYKGQQVDDWRRLYRALTPDQREEFLGVLALLNNPKTRKQVIEKYAGQYGDLIEHYYPGGKAIRY